MSEPQAPLPNPTRGQRWTVYATLVAAVLLAVSLLAVIGYRWMTQRTPTSTVIVRATPELAGATITIIGDGQPADRTAALPSTGDIVTPLFLEAGGYTIRIEHQGRLALHESIYVRSGVRYEIDLRNPATSPTSRP